MSAPMATEEESLRRTEKDATGEEPYVFHTDHLPCQRQLFYQLCDLRDKKLQEIVHGNDGMETECDVSSVCGMANYMSYDS